MNAQKFAAIFLVLALAAGAAALMGWRKAGGLERANSELQVELAEARKLTEAAETSARSGSEATQSEMQAQKNELMRLRNEVTQLRAGNQSADALRAENTQLKGQIQQLRTSAAQAVPLPQQQPYQPQQESFPREQWQFSGYQTPEAALVSAIWAMKEGRPEVYLDSLSPEEQERMALRWENQTEQQVASKHQQDVANISGLRIMTSDTTSPNEVRMTVVLDGLDRTEEVRMHQVNGQWKFGGFVQPPQVPPTP